MHDLDEQIRTLIDDVEAVGVAEVITGRMRQRKVARLYLPVATVAAALVVVAVIAATLAASGGPGSPSPHLRWHLSGYIGPSNLSVQGSPGSGTYALECPTTSTCYATEPVVVSQTVVPNGVVEVSTDGGRTWHPVLDKPGADLFGLSCPSELVCAVTGENFASGSPADTMYSTTDSGETWTEHVIPGGSQSSSLLACSSASICVATTTADAAGSGGESASALVTRDGGAAWKSASFPQGFVPGDLECGVSACVATGVVQQPQVPTLVNGAYVNGPGKGVGAVAYSRDGGLTWHLGRAPAADFVLGVSCADAEHCMAIGETLLEPGTPFRPGPLTETVISTSDGGATWVATVGNEPSRWQLSDVACPSASDCWISGATHPQGETEEQISQSSNNVQPFVQMTTDGGVTWHPVPLPEVNGQSLSNIGSLSCPATSSCLALANNPGSHSGIFPPEVVLSTS